MNIFLCSAAPDGAASCYGTARRSAAHAAAHLRALHSAGLTRRPVGAVGALSNAAGAQSVPCADEACARRARELEARNSSRPGVDGTTIRDGGFVSNKLPQGWRPEHAAHAAWLGAPREPGGAATGAVAAAAPLAGVLDGFLVLARREVFERVWPLDALRGGAAPSAASALA